MMKKLSGIFLTLIFCVCSLSALDSDGDGLPDKVEKELGTPADTAAVFHEVYRFKKHPAPVADPQTLEKISVAHVAEDRYIWKAEFSRKPDPEKLVLHFYVDADENSATGRQSGTRTTSGTDYMCSIIGGNSNINFYGKTLQRLNTVRWHQEDKVLYLVVDTPLKIVDGKCASSVYVMCHNQGDKSKKVRIIQVNSTGKIKFSIPLNRGKKILRPLDSNVPWNMKRTYGASMIKKLLFATPGVVFVPYDKLSLDGFEVNLNCNRHFGEVITSRKNSSVYTKAPAGKYYPAILVYDDPSNSCFELTIDGVSKGVAPVSIGNNRYWIYYLDKPVDFRGGEEVRVFLRSANTHRFSGIAFLPFEPEQNGLPYKISHLCAFTPQREAGTAKISWLTEMPSISRFEYGKDGKFNLTAEKHFSTLVHQVGLKNLDVNSTYTGRAVAYRPDGTKYVSGEITFKPVPAVKKSGSVSAASLPVKVTVDEPLKFAPGLVTTGIPFPKGALSSAPAMRLSRNGVPVPLQYKVTGWWDDGSAKWVLLSFVTQHGVSGDLIYDLEYGNDIPAPAAEKPLASINKKNGSVYIGKDRRVDRQGNLLVYKTPVRTAIKLSGYPDAKWDKNAELSIEYNGHVRAVVKSLRKLNSADGKPLVALEQRFTFAVGTPSVEIAHTFTILHGKPFLDVESISVDVPHIKASFPVPYFQRNEKEINCGGSPVTGQLSGSVISAPVSVAVRDFWQNYPKGFASDGKRLSIQLCPQLTDDYYDNFPFEKEGHHLFYYLRDRKYRFKEDMSKTHHITVITASDNNIVSAAAGQARYRLLGVAPAEWYCSSGAFYDVLVQDYKQFAPYERMTDNNMNKYRSMRHFWRDYGMMNFGDWYPERGANWGNSEYDTQMAFFLQFIRSGNREAFFLGEEMQLHNRDIDTPASTGGVLLHQMGHVGHYYKTGVPGTLGIPRAGTSISHAWAEGDFVHYFMTGDVRSYENACRKISFFIDKSFRRPYDFTSLRVPGWHLIMNSYALASTNDPYFLNASRLIVERVLELQDKVHIPLPAHQQTAERKSYIGGWMRMMVPGHCVCVPRCKGNANFMVAVLLSGMKYYYDVTNDPRVKESIINGAKFLVESCYSDKTGGFRYTPCLKMKYPRSTSPLMTEGIARAYMWTQDKNLVHPLYSLLRKGTPKSIYGKAFSMYYRSAPRVLADLAKGGVNFKTMPAEETAK